MKTIINLIIFKLTFDLVYVFVISQCFQHALFDYHPFIYKYIFSSLVYAIIMPSIIYVANKTDVASRILFIINLIYFIPACSLYSLAGLSDSGFIFFAVYWFLTMYIYILSPNFKVLRFPTRKVLPIFISFNICVVILCLFISGYYNHFKITLNFWEVYGLRDEMKGMGIPLIFMYFMPAASVIVPILIMHFMLRKKYILALLLIVVQILMFSIGGMKKTLFFLPILFFLFYFFRYRNFKIIIPFVSILNILALIEYYVTESALPIIANFIQRRTMLTPVMISFNYIDFFSVNDPDYLSQSVFSRFGVVSQYKMDIQNIISGKYYGNTEGVASNGICGDAFGNFGWWSLLIYPALFVFILHILKACSTSINPNILLLLSSIYAVYLTNGSLFSTLLTNGLLLIILFLFVYPKDSIK